MHYQLHTCALKYLLRGTKEELVESEPSILNIISQVQQLPLGRGTYPALWEWVRRLVGGAKGITMTREESPEELSSGGSCGSSSRLPETPPLAHAIHPAKVHVPSSPSLPSSEKLEGLMDTVDVNMESEVNEMDTSEAPEQQPTIASLGNDNVSGQITPALVQLEPQRTIEDSLMEAALASQKESKQSIQTESSLSPETLKTASPPPKPSVYVEHVSSNLLQQCIYGIAVCAVRCPAHFKPRYRLAAVLAKIGQTKVKPNHTVV